MSSPLGSNSWVCVVGLAVGLLSGCGSSPPGPPVSATPPTAQQVPQSQPREDLAADPPPPVKDVAELRVRLARAFESLRKQGIVAEPRFEIDVRNAVVAMTQLLEERKAPGGVYWHDQDDDNLQRGEDLHIGFVGREDRDAVAIAEKLVAALKAEGLTVEWDGRADQRVVVKVPRPPTEQSATE